jgi:uncharacterized protein (UPF0548 family)
VKATLRGRGRAADRMLVRMARKEPTYSPSAPPDGKFLTTGRRVRVNGSLSNCGAALLDWTVHRRAGLHVAASLTPAEVGATVVLCSPLGPLWALAPCRVTDVESSDDRVRLVYATLPGHPEQGAEEFSLTRDASGTVWFGVSARSRPASWFVALGAPVSRRIQRQITDAYVQAMLSIR